MMGKTCIWVLAALASLALGNLLFPAPGLLGTGEALAGSGPHFTGGDCALCHDGSPRKGGPAPLKGQGRYDALCRCHTDTPDDWAHPIALEPPDGRRALERFPLEDGQITCNACHDLALLHRETPESARAGLGRAFSVKTENCRGCHDRETVDAFSPHRDQLDGQGRIRPGNCLLCHATVPDPKAGFADVDFVEDMNQSCRRCHAVEEPHPYGVTHGMAPSAAGLQRIADLTRRFGLPLVLKGEKMTCATCHNPHQKGVQPPGSPGAAGADSPLRHRVPGTICLECHQV